MCGDISVKIRKYHSSLPASATPPMFGAESSGENFTKICDLKGFEIQGEHAALFGICAHPLLLINEKKEKEEDSTGVKSTPKDVRQKMYTMNFTWPVESTFVFQCTPKECSQQAKKREVK